MGERGVKRGGPRMVALVLGTALTAAGIMAAVLLSGRKAPPVIDVATAPLPTSAPVEPRTELAGSGGADGLLPSAVAAAEEVPASAGGSQPTALAPAGSERTAVAFGLHGRVIEATSGEPIAGVEVEHSFAGSVDARARSGPDGAFAFETGVAARGTLRAVDPRWWFEPARFRFQGRGPAAEVVFKGTRVVAAPVDGRIVDERTGAPVSRYRLTLRPGAGMRRVPPKDGEDKDEELVTDEDGRFTSASSYEAGSLGVFLSELGDVLRLEHRIEGEKGVPLELEIAVGPAFYFDIEAPAGAALDELEASLLLSSEPPARWQGRAVERGYTGFLDTPLSSASAYGFPSDPEAYVRSDGDPAWIRLAPLDPNDMPARGPNGYALRLLDEQAHLAGMGYAPSLAGSPDQRVPVRLMPFCELSGTVATDDGVPVHGAWVRLRGPSLAEELVCVTDWNGSFSCVAPLGPYELAADSLRGTVEESVSLGEPEVSVALRLRGPKTMRVAGTLRSRSGSFKARPRIELCSTTNPELRFKADVDFATTSVRRNHDVTIRNTNMTEATFEARNLPAGSYEVRATSPGGFAWEPVRSVVDRSTADLQLVYLDDTGGTALYFDVHEPDGTLVTNAHAGVWVGGESTFDKTSYGEPVCAVATGADVRWAVYAPGYVPVAGACRIAQPERQRIAVQLERGAGLFVMAMDPSGTGVEGAEILLDEESAGVTDEVGVAVLALHGEVTSVRARRPGWIFVDSAFDLDLEFGEAMLQLVPED